MGTTVAVGLLEGEKDGSNEGLCDGDSDNVGLLEGGKDGI